MIFISPFMDTQDNSQFSLRLIAYFEWNSSMGNALKNIRNKQNISLRNLAIKIGEKYGIEIDHTYLGKLEQGKADSVKKDKLLAITDFLGITVNDLET